MINKGVCDKGYSCNPSNCGCECNKSCDIGKYLDYKNCKCRKSLVNKLVEEHNETIDEVKLTKIILADIKVVINVILVYCTLYCFQYSLQLMLELVLLLLTIST